MTDSRANFIFVRHPAFAGDVLYRALRDKGILVRHFNTERIADYLRITVGSKSECTALVQALAEIIKTVQKGSFV